jgi:hypothetical protein
MLTRLSARWDLILDDGSQLHHKSRLQVEHVRHHAPPLSAAQERGRKGGSQQQHLDIGDGGVVKVEQLQRGAHGVAALHVRRRACNSAAAAPVALPGGRRVGLCALLAIVPVP